MSGGVDQLTDEEIAEAYDCIEAGTRVRTRLVRKMLSAIERFKTAFAESDCYGDSCAKEQMRRTLTGTFK